MKEDKVDALYGCEDDVVDNVLLPDVRTIVTAVYVEQLVFIYDPVLHPPRTTVRGDDLACLSRRALYNGNEKRVHNFQQ